MLRSAPLVLALALLGGCGDKSDDDASGDADTGASDGGASDGGDEGGGSCVNGDVCTEVLDPPDYNLRSECQLFGGTWSATLCNTTPYDTQCTQEVEVSEGAQTQTVTYVLYWSSDSGYTCVGEEAAI